MSEYTTTPNLGLIKPNYNQDDGLWGGHLNGNADKIDAVSTASFIAKNVKRLGAVGDGITDDTAVIRAAVASGGCIYFPTGRYKVSGQAITVPSNTRLTGDGTSVSVILGVNLTALSGSGTGAVLINSAFAAAGYPPSTGIAPPPAPLPDHNITVDNLTFDVSASSPTISCGFICFMYLENFTMHDVTVIGTGAPHSIDSCKLIGCTNFTISRYRAFDVANAVDCWMGTQRGKISDCLFIASTGGTNGGLVNWQGYYNVCDDLQISNTTFWINNCFAMDFDPLAGGPSQNILLENIVISARSGAAWPNGTPGPGQGNIGIIMRGNVNRLKARGISFEALPGADMRPMLVGGIFDTVATQSGPNLITTTAGSSQITINVPIGMLVGPTEYMNITGVAANGLSFGGYYRIISATPWPPIITAGGASGRPTSFVVDLYPQVATVTGPVTTSVSVRGYRGSPVSFDLQGLTLDGIFNSGGDLLPLSGFGFNISGVTVTNNYNNSRTPRYRAIISIDASLHLNDVPLTPFDISGIIGAPGTQPLQAGWSGDNIVTWQAFTPPPIRSQPTKGTFDPVLKFGAGPSSDIVYSEQAGVFSKFGGIVSFSFNIAISNKGVSTGVATISGFPFPINSWGGEARGSYTANFGSRIAISPSGTTTPIVYSATVNSLLYTITTPGSGGATGVYPLNLTGGTGSGASATFTVVGNDSVLSLPVVGGSGGTDGQYPLTFTSVDGLGSGAAGDIIVTNGIITETLLNARGSGYTAPPTVSYTVPGLTGSSVTAALGVGAIISISVATRGTYTVAPTADTSACPGLTGASIAVAVNTAGISKPSEVMGRFSSGVMFVALDRDALGVNLTNTEINNGTFLRMIGWYFTNS